MSKRLVLLVGLIGLTPILFAGFASKHPVEAAPESQTQFQTPTPMADGRIIYIVKEGDSLWTIAALSGLTVEEVRALNGIQPNDFISPGMELILGLGGPAQPTEAVIAETSPTPLQTTPTPLVGTGEVCVLLFVDQNGNARWDEGEPPLIEGQISVADVDGIVVGERATDENPEGYCFIDVLFGDYNVSAAVPAGYNPTTAMSVPLRLQPGDIKYVDFGAQPSAALAGITADENERPSTLLGVIGIVLLLAAGGLAYYATRYGRKNSLIRS
jgi:hypothetical protein